jgi:hypothetical protein
VAANQADPNAVACPSATDPNRKRLSMNAAQINAAYVAANGVSPDINQSALALRPFCAAPSWPNNTLPNLIQVDSGVVTSQGFNLTSDNGSGFQTQPTDILNTDPLLAPLDNYGGPTPTLALSPYSPALDKGISNGLLTDQRGFARTLDDPTLTNAPGGDGTDIGAFEGTAPAGVSDQAAGSVLIYNFYASSASNPALENTRLNLTNTSETEDLSVHLFFVDGETCSVADNYVCLTKSQTMSFLMSDIDPGVSGYVVAVAVNSRTGAPIFFNQLIGDAYIKLASGHTANLGAEAIAAQVADPASTNASAMTATLNFDNVSYNALPLHGWLSVARAADRERIPAHHTPPRQHHSGRRIGLAEILGDSGRAAARCSVGLQRERSEQRECLQPGTQPAQAGLHDNRHADHSGLCAELSVSGCAKLGRYQSPRCLKIASSAGSRPCLFNSNEGGAYSSGAIQVR